MSILVAYGSTEGHTRKIAERISECLRQDGHEVQLYDTARRSRGLEVSDFDAVVLAASVHHKEHQETVTNFVRAHRDQLKSMPVLFLSVSLSAAFDEGRADAEEYVDRFVAITGWQPTQFVHVAGALRYSEYDYFKEQIIEHLVLKGRKVGVPQGDYELTDWDSLLKGVRAFAQKTRK